MCTLNYAYGVLTYLNREPREEPKIALVTVPVTPPRRITDLSVAAAKLGRGVSSVARSPSITPVGNVAEHRTWLASPSKASSVKYGELR